ncbi:MAG: site-specific integrase [Desulfovibrio sp.]|jgi:integrase|nr:site-specific integrase [Desulfovibrio sp.]
MPYQMPNGKWRGKRMINGKVKTKVFLGKREAIAWEVQQSVEAWNAPALTTPTICLLDFANAYLDFAKERFAKTTMCEMKMAFKRLFRMIDPSLTPELLSAALAQNALRAVLKETRPKTTNNTRKNLATAWEWGKKFYGLPKLNPFLEVPKFPADETPRYVPPESDFWEVYDQAEGQDKTLLLFLLHTGARRGEAFGLKWEDVDLQGGKVRLGTRKRLGGGMEYDWIPLTTELREALAEHKRDACSLYVFTSVRYKGNRFYSRHRFVRELCKSAGVRPFGYHAIRHLTATILAYAGLDIPTVQAILRHKSPNTTARYIKSLGVGQDKLDSVFAKRRGPKVLAFEPPKMAVGT